MAKQIMVSNEVYRLLSKDKKNKSFSEVIKMLVKSKEQKRPKASSLAGLLKNDKKLLKLKKAIEKERENSVSRAFEKW